MANVSERVRRYRNALRDAGLRPLQIWVPDVNKPGFADECRRQSRLLGHDYLETETAEWLETVADRDGWQ